MTSATKTTTMILFIAVCSAWEKTNRIETFNIKDNNQSPNWSCIENLDKNNKDFSFCKNTSSYNLGEIKCQLSIRNYGKFRRKWDCSPDRTTEVPYGKPFIKLEHKITCKTESYLFFSEKEICKLNTQAIIYSYTDYNKSLMAEIIEMISAIIILTIIGPIGMALLCIIGSITSFNSCNNGVNFTSVGSSEGYSWGGTSTSYE